MGIVDMFSSEDRVQVKFSDFYNLVKEASKAELLLNGVKNGVDHASMYTMTTGRAHPECKVHSHSVHTVEMHLGEENEYCCDSCAIPSKVEISTEEEKDNE